MTFNDVIKQLRDGRAYTFGHNNLNGFFYKAPFPAKDEQTKLDKACSAITYWMLVDGKARRASPTLMLYDFDNGTEWYCRLAFRHPDGVWAQVES